MNRIGHSIYLLLTVLAVGGCGTSRVEFSVNDLAAIEAELATPHRLQIERVLTDLFGTPDEPRAPASTELDIEKLRMAAGPAGYVRNDAGDEYLQQGLYRQHCASCHGVTGDGYGSAASMLSPYPRNFRTGVFKFKSTYLSNRPTVDDLRGILQRGIPGTAMPSFNLLSPEQVDSLVEYVRYLSMRGQVERQLIGIVADEFDYDIHADTTSDPLDPKDDDEDRSLVSEVVAEVAEPWLAAEQSLLVPDPATVPPEVRTPEVLARSIEAGEALFRSSRINCTDCHGATGSGQIVRELDDWSREVFEFKRETAALADSLTRREQRFANLPARQREQAAKQLQFERRLLRQRRELVDTLLEPQLARPRDLQSGVYRGGSEPIDLFRRVHQGIAGTPMPAHGSPRPGVPGALTEEEIWQIVDYLKSLPSPEAL